jgi:hypothetical protein
MERLRGRLAALRGQVRPQPANVAAGD